jgi:prolyl-tRNA synthetase
MRYSELFGKTRKEAPKDEVATNAKLLLRAGFIDKLMAGSYTLLPLGFRVVKKIEQIIREEINKTGGEELLMPLLHPKSIWNETGRWEKAKEVMYQLKKDDREYALSFTHEEIVLDLIRKHSQSFRDYPIKVYHFSTKFRDELRAKSGILRGREFIMKDLYSLHKSKEDFEKYYEEVKEAYLRIFERLGLRVVVTEAGGGVFTENVTHEFQVLSDSGEDEIIYCEGGDFAQNVEIAKVKEGKECDLGHGPLKKAKAIEVGNIFSFGQDYCKKMNITFTNEKGEKEYPYFGSYGIGLTRAMGTIAETLNDERGIIWPKSVAPYQVHLVSLEKDAAKIYEKLKSLDIEVLWDDREVSAGEKFKDADLIGIPVRLVVSAKTGDKVEWKERAKEDSELLSIDEVIKKLEA